MISFRQYIEQIIGRSLEFFDYKKLNINAWRMYYNDAQFISNNETFNNELHHYISDLVKFGSLESQDFNQVLNTRSAITALETFRERLSEIENPDKPLPKREEIHEAI